MKLIICDICGTRISNHSDLSNTATIGGRDIEICDSCRREILDNLVTEGMSYIQKVDDGLANINRKSKRVVDERDKDKEMGVK